MTTWRKEIQLVLDCINEPIIACTLSEDELDVEFYYGYGISEDEQFTAWTENYVIFPVVYDGLERASYTYRNPCDKHTGHIGGQ
jgi:hypothetical protein